MRRGEVEAEAVEVGEAVCGSVPGRAGEYAGRAARWMAAGGVLSIKLLLGVT